MHPFSLFEQFSKKLSGIWESPEDIGKRAVRSGTIAFIEKLLLKSGAFIRTVIIARLLLPNDIGLFGMASLAIAATTIFFQPGLHSAIVQEKEDVRKHLNSVWSAKIMLGLFLSLLLYLVSAPLAGLFFHDPQVVLLTRALAIIALVASLENIGIVLFERELRFNKLFTYNVVGQLSQMIFTVIAAFIFRNVWALVIGTIIGRTLFVLISYWVSPYRPKFTFDLSGARYLFRYGKWVGLAGIAAFFVGQGDNLTIGRLLDASQLAYYQLAFSLGTLPATEIVGVLGGILFPLYANLQGDRTRLKRTFFRVARLAFSIAIPAALGLFVLARETVVFVYGSRWLPMVPILYVILLYGLFRSFELLTKPVFLGIGKPRLTTAVLVIQAAVMFSVIVPLTHMWGAVGAGIAALAGYIVAQAIYMYRLRRDLSIGMMTVAHALLVPLFAGSLMASALWFMKPIVPVISSLTLLAYIASGVVLYFAFLWIIDRMTGSHTISAYRWVRQNV